MKTNKKLLSLLLAANSIYATQALAIGAEVKSTSNAAGSHLVSSGNSNVDANLAAHSQTKAGVKVNEASTISALQATGQAMANEAARIKAAASAAISGAAESTTHAAADAATSAKHSSEAGLESAMLVETADGVSIDLSEDHTNSSTTDVDLSSVNEFTTHTGASLGLMTHSMTEVASDSLVETRAASENLAGQLIGSVGVNVENDTSISAASNVVTDVAAKADAALNSSVNAVFETAHEARANVETITAAATAQVNHSVDSSNDSVSAIAESVDVSQQVAASEQVHAQVAGQVDERVNNTTSAVTSVSSVLKGESTGALSGGLF